MNPISKPLKRAEMEEMKKKSETGISDKEILYSQSIKAGKRIYYLDVKRSRKEDLFIAITESKKIVTGEGTESQVNFEKHKIFLYREDFDKFVHGLQQAMAYIDAVESENLRQERDEAPRLSPDDEFKIDIEF